MLSKLHLLLPGIFIFLLASPANACLNYYYSADENGMLHNDEDVLYHFNSNFNKELIASKLAKLAVKIKNEHSYKLLSDYAVLLLKGGKTKEALELFDNLYYAHSTEFQLASNLGTAYELNGMNDSALKFIKRGIELNPQDHDGSEWVHVKILEAKINLAKDPHWLAAHNILSLTEIQLHNTAVRNQVFIQAKERFPFTPGPDPIMAGIMKELGDCFAATLSVEYAKALYNMAQNYYGDSSAVLATKIKNATDLINKYATKAPPFSRDQEGMSHRIGFITFKSIMDDNDPRHYRIDWTTINTDVKSLLGFTGTNVTVAQLRLLSPGKPATDSTTASVPAGRSEEPVSGMTLLFGIIIPKVLFILLIAGGVIYFFVKRKKQH